MNIAATTQPRLLLIDDDPITGRLLQAVFKPEAITVSTAETGTAGLDAVAAELPDVLVLDLRLPDLSGMEVLQQLQARWPKLPVVVLTGRVEVKTAVQAMQLGAFHYLTKPMDRDELVLVTRRALQHHALDCEVADLRRQVEPAAALTEQMGPSDAVQRLIDLVLQVAPSDLSVLILGETGTGKELIAQAIHRQSPRRQRPLIPVDCGSIPEALLESELFGHEKGAFTGAERRSPGQFKAAEGGTLFLDETANLPLPLQPKLLRVLESRELRPVGACRPSHIDVRVLAATNVGLQGQVRQGRFREDLYFRLAQFTIRLPPLRERAEDIPHLTRRFVNEICLELKRPVIEITPAALSLLQQQRWPGNVRELRNCAHQAVLRCRGMSLHEALVERLLHDQEDAALSPVASAVDEPGSLREIGERAAQAAERRAICAALRSQQGNKSAVARQLQTDYKTLHLKIRRYAIAPTEYR